MEDLLCCYAGNFRVNQPGVSSFLLSYGSIEGKIETVTEGVSEDYTVY